MKVSCRQLREHQRKTFVTFSRFWSLMTHWQISKKLFRKVLFMWPSMPIFSFIRYTLTKLFRKPDNWQQIYKQTSSTFYTSNDVSRRKNYFNIITRLQNSFLITFFKKIQKQPLEVQKQSPEVFYKKGFFKNFINLTGKHLCWSLFCSNIKLQALNLQVFLKRASNMSAFLWS